MYICPVCGKDFKSMNDLIKHITYLAAWNENNEKWRNYTHHLFLKNLHIKDQSFVEIKSELKKLGVEKGKFIHFDFVPEPKEKKEASSGWEVIQLLWDKADLSKILSGIMTWQEWEHFTKRHGEEIYFKEPAKCGCIRRLAKGEMEWQELLIHLEVELNYRLSGS